VALTVFIVSFLVLGYLGGEPPSPLYTSLSRLFSILYFAFFGALLILPMFEKTKPVPDRVTSK
jgi:ubiquinol-cytochrome c reductase cytochrome b subunit